MKIELVRTGKRIRFLDLYMGSPFYAHGKMWTRNSYSAATVIGYSGYHGSACDFTIDAHDEFVEFVNYVVTDDNGEPVISQYGPTLDQAAIDKLEPLEQ